MMPEKAWEPEHSVLPSIEINGEQVTIRNIRDFWYPSPGAQEVKYVDRTFALADVRSVDLFISLYNRFLNVAHTFLGFRFADGTCITISIEMRRYHGEVFTLRKGFFEHHPLMYVIATEPDAVRFRTVGGFPVYRYQLAIEPQRVQNLFIDMLQRARELQAQPEEYRLLTNSCTTNLIHHINVVAPKQIPYGLRTLLSAQLDTTLKKLGLIDGSESQETHRISDPGLQAPALEEKVH